MKKILRGPLLYVFLVLAIILLTSNSQLFAQKDDRVLEYKDFLSKIQTGEVVKVLVAQNNVVALKKDSQIAASDFPTRYDYSSYLPSIAQFNADLSAIYSANGTLGYGNLSLVYKEPDSPSFFAQMWPYLIMFGLVIGLWYFMMRQSQGGGKAMNFGKSRAKMTMGEHTGKTFADVAGAKEEKEELAEIVEFLRNPKRFTKLGARIPKGVLLVGPPGGGKTLLAKAVAGEAKVPFFSISGSDFVEMFVGVGASRVRDLFDNAKKNAPSIIFIDEIDAVGRHRGAGLGGGHDEREQTLNQLLVEMDGFLVNEGVIVIAATNRVDILDPALLRPGRFDRQIFVNYPDVKGREEILKVHSRGKPLAPEVDLKVLARRTPGFTGADLENVLNEAAILTARSKREAIGMREIEEAITRVVVGPEKKSRVVTDKDRRCTAIHEVGHAICAKVLPGCDPVHEVSVIPRGMAAGYTMTLPKEDDSHLFRSKMRDEIAMMLGGRVAEALILNDISTGASNDIQRATETATSMVVRFGMSDELGPIYLGGEQEVFLGKSYGHAKNYSEAIASKIDGEVKRILDEAYEAAMGILTQYKAKLLEITNVLLVREKLDEAEFEALFEGRPLPEKAQTPEAPHESEPDANPAAPEAKTASKEAEAPVAEKNEPESAE